MAARWLARSVACRDLMASRESHVAGDTGSPSPLKAGITGYHCLLPSVQPGIQAALYPGRCGLWEGLCLCPVSFVPPAPYISLCRASEQINLPLSQFPLAVYLSFLMLELL